MKACPRAAVTACVLLLLLVACACRSANLEPVWEPPAADAVGNEIFQTGVASWYGDDFQGRPTADGEIYDMHKLTAAHQELPFHTLVEVENLENGRRVVVRVNDRGPFLKDRIIDLSLKAATRLEMTDKGTIEVNLRVVRWGGAAPKGSGVSGANDVIFPSLPFGCFVQVGAFSFRENAEDLLLTLGDIFPDLAFRVAEEDGLFKVISPKLDSADECRDVLQKLSDFHLRGFIRASDAPPAK